MALTATSGRRLLVVAAAVVATLTAPSAHAASGARIVQARTTDFFHMTTPGWKQVRQVTLPAGLWTVNAKAFAVDLGGETDFVRCQIRDATHRTQLDASTGQLKPGYPGGMITEVSNVNVPPGQQVGVQLRCGHDSSAGNQAYLDPGATLLAYRDPSPSATRLAYTQGQAQLSSSGPTTVLGTNVSAGTWLIGFKATAVYLDPQKGAFVSCWVDIDSGRAAERGVGGVSYWPAAATMVGFTTITTPRVTGFDLVCSGDDGTYIDPSAALWARQVGGLYPTDSCEAQGAAPRNADLVVDLRADSDFCTIGLGVSDVGGVDISAGSWVVLGAEQEVTTSARNEFVRCQAADATHQKVSDGGATMWSSGGGWTGTTYLGKLTPTSRAVVLFSCTQDDTNNGDATSYDGSYVLLRP